MKSGIMVTALMTIAVSGGSEADLGQSSGLSIGATTSSARPDDSTVQHTLFTSDEGIASSDVETLFLESVGELMSTQTLAIQTALDALLGWEAREGEQAVRPGTVEFTKHWLATLERLVAGGWQLPGVTASPFGEVVLEWREGERRLTFFVDEGRVEFLRSWGLSDAEMTDGDVGSQGDAMSHLQWLRVGV